MDFSQLPERIFCTLWCHDSISKVAKQWLVLCGDIKHKVICTNESHISDNNENTSNESKSINDNVVINVLSNNDSTQNSTKKGEITEYVGESVLTGRSANEMESALESQRRSHHDSSEDTGDSDHFAAPVKVSPHPPKKRPPVVVSSGKSRSIPVVQHGQDLSHSCSQSPSGRLPSVSHSTSSGKHNLTFSIGYEPKPPRGSGAPRVLRSPCLNLLY